MIMGRFGVNSSLQKTMNIRKYQQGKSGIKQASEQGILIQVSDYQMELKSSLPLEQLKSNTKQSVQYHPVMKIV